MHTRVHNTIGYTQQSTLLHWHYRAKKVCKLMQLQCWIYSLTANAKQGGGGIYPGPLTPPSHSRGLERPRLRLMFVSLSSPHQVTWLKSANEAFNLAWGPVVKVPGCQQHERAGNVNRPQDLFYSNHYQNPFKVRSRSSPSVIHRLGVHDIDMYLDIPHILTCWASSRLTRENGNNLGISYYSHGTQRIHNLLCLALQYLGSISPRLLQRV